MQRCGCGFTSPPELETFSAEWHRQHRTHHLATFSDVDAETRRNLDYFVEYAEGMPSWRA